MATPPNSLGLRRGSREWLFALRAYYSSDPDVVALCEEYEVALDTIEKGNHGTTKRDSAEEVIGIDDEWSTGG